MEVVEEEEEEEAVADGEYCGETQQQLHNRRQRLRNRLKLAVIGTAEREGLCPDFSSFRKIVGGVTEFRISQHCDSLF
jgi:hypothetical protein